jgi:alkylated DNA repair dioxygenase AlkB
MAVEIESVPGLYFTPEVLTEEQERDILVKVKAEPGKPVAQIHPAGEYGWPFRPSNGSLGPPLAPDDSYGIMPPWLQEAWASCVAGGNMPSSIPRQLPDHVLANTYPVGDGCRAHTDDTQCWTGFVVGLSLGSGATMEFRRGAGPVVRIFMPRRSMYVLTGPARWEFTHAVTAATHDDVDGVVIPRGERVSFTFRNIAQLSEWHGESSGTGWPAYSGGPYLPVGSRPAVPLADEPSSLQPSLRLSAQAAQRMNLRPLGL